MFFVYSSYTFLFKIVIIINQYGVVSMELMVLIQFDGIYILKFKNPNYNINMLHNYEDIFNIIY